VANQNTISMFKNDGRPYDNSLLVLSGLAVAVVFEEAIWDLKVEKTNCFGSQK